MNWYEILRNENLPVWQHCVARMEVLFGLSSFLRKRKWEKIIQNWPKKLKNV